MKYIFLATAAILCLNSSYADNTKHPLSRNEIYRQKTVDKKTGEMRSRLSGELKTISQNRYFLNKSGQGKYSKFKDISWDLESETELKKNILCPLYTIFTIRDKDGHDLFKCKNEYDYDKKIIIITQSDANNEAIKELTFPLETNTTDYANLVHFLRPFINDLRAGKIIRFNFVSGEPGLYKLKAQFIKEETLTIGSQEIEALQIKIIPDMGMINLIADRFVPPTLLWYEKNKPHAWLKYEGLESGRGSANIITTVEEIPPFSNLLSN